MAGDRDDQSDQGDEQTTKDVVASFSTVVRAGGEQIQSNCSACVWWHGHEVGLDGRVAESTNDQREEDAEGLPGHASQDVEEEDVPVPASEICVVQTGCLLPRSNHLPQLPVLARLDPVPPRQWVHIDLVFSVIVLVILIRIIANAIDAVLSVCSVQEPR